jgi:hypothetical protein
LLQVELLETRNLMSSGSFALTTLVPVSGDSPLPAFVNPDPPAPPTVLNNSEVEPQIAVDPTHNANAVAIWQQDRFRSVGGARALVVSVSNNASDATSSWSTPTAIPYFDSTNATFNTIDPATGLGYTRYTDPWVSIAPNGTVWVSALALTPTGPIPGHTAVLALKGSIVTDGNGNPSISWDSAGPTMLIHDDAPPGTDPADLANDKEMIVADPTNANNVFVVWDRLNHPSDSQNFNAAHGLPFREDMMFARTTDGGVTWNGGNYPQAVAGYPASDVTNFKANESAFGNQILVQSDGTLVDLFTDATGSGNQGPQADHNVVGVMRSTDHGATWSKITTGPGIEGVDVTDPDTGAPVRAGEPLISVALDPNARSIADPNGGNLYAVWPDGRFSKLAHDDIAFSMSTDGGLTWSDPIKVNQTTGLTDGDKQAFTPTVSVNSDGTVAVSYYDFRNNTTTDSIAATDYWLVHASSNLTNPSSWTSNEKQLTDHSFNIENAAQTSRGYFLGDYQGLAAAGQNFYALFAQAGTSTSDPSNIWFRDPPPAPDSVGLEDAGLIGARPTVAIAPTAPAVNQLAAAGVNVFAASVTNSDSTIMPGTNDRLTIGEPPPLMDDAALVATSAPAAESGDNSSTYGDGSTTHSVSDGQGPVDAVFSEGFDGSLSE